MAETSSPVVLVIDVPQLIELSPTSGTLKRFDVPVNARALLISPLTGGALHVVRGGTDAAAIGASAYEIILSRTTTPIRVTGTNGRSRNMDTSTASSNSRRVCISGNSSATFVIVAVESSNEEAVGGTENALLYEDNNGVHQYGHAHNGLQLTDTDVWPRADMVPTQQIWLAPTAARIHAIVSTSASDDGAPVGVGARTLRISGLTSWTTIEVSEDVVLNGATPVNTVNAYVMINTMKVLTSGATSINVGTITATAATDGTITAVIDVGSGQTAQAIYGIPSGRALLLSCFQASIVDKSTTTRADFVLRINENPNAQTTNYIVKARIHAIGVGQSAPIQTWDPYLRISGPAIAKLQGLSSDPDVDCSASFVGYLVAD